MSRRVIPGIVALTMFAFAPQAAPADLVRISEFMALPDRSFPDELGEFSDWIELHNDGTTTVNLDGWYLTDRASDLTQWRFPATNLLANAYLIVFATGNDRRVPGAPLHTNFRLSGDGEYLALVRPDGVTVASSFAAQVQATGVSFGSGLQETATTLVAGGASSRFHVPQDGSLADTWTLLGFNDSDWTTATTGVGYELDGTVPFVPATVADSVGEFSGTQGQANWYYGYWNQKADGDGVYQPSEFIPFPNIAGPHGANNFWNGTGWDWFNGDPPYTQLSGQEGRASGDGGSPALPAHWTIRRYVSEVEGPIQISGRVTPSGWVYVTATGTATSPALYVYLTGLGEGYLDDMKLVVGTQPEVGANLIANGDFEAPNLSTSWTVSQNLAGSSLSTAVKHGGTRSLRMVSTAAGSTRDSSIWQNVAGLLANQVYTLSYWYLPGASSPPLIVRFSGGWIVTTPDYCGDGVICRVLVDGTEVFQQLAVVNSPNYSITVPVHAGSAVDFVLDGGQANNASCDTTVFTARVDTADPTVNVVADSVADWSVAGNQGEKNWYYGYYNRSTDADGTYQANNFVAFPRSTGPQGTNNFWDEEEWDWFNGNPPFDKIGQYWMTPNGLNNGAEHWVIRRWISESSGSVSVEWAGSKEFLDQYHTGGGGAVVRVYHKGVLRDSVAIGGNDVFGVHRTVQLTGVQVGDPIDIALDPSDLDGTSNDDQDRTFVTMKIRGEINLNPQITSSVQSQMHEVNASAYLRLNFNVADPAPYDSLTLRMKHDDGYIAYLNGVEVARANAPLVPAWNSTAAGSRSDADARDFEVNNISASLGLLRSGANVLAIHGLNAAADDGDFLLLPELVATTVTVDSSAPRYFMTPTPGTANGFGNPNLGPLILSATHAPTVPSDNQNLQVTATLAPTFRPIGAVRLIYRTMYSNEVNVSMFDDGLHADGGASDGVWGATIPATASNPGQMVRYYVFATDSAGNSSRFPAFADPKNSPQYQGTVVVNPGLTNPLPVLHFFVQNTVMATNYTGTRCSIFWDEEFFDNVGVNAHGQTTWFVFPKRSMDFNMNTGEKLRWKRGEERVKAFDLLSTYADRAYMRLVMGFETFRDAGVPTHYAFPVRVQQNNGFHSVAHFVEQANDDFLERNGLDPDGSLYKIYFPLTNAYSGVHKETRKNEPNDDLQELIDGLSQSGTALRQHLFDNLDVPEVVNFFATIEVVQNEDCCGYKNYYLHRDTHGNGEWRILPWDLDLTFGRTFTDWVYMRNQQGQVTNVSGGYFDTSIYWTNKWYKEQRAPVPVIGFPGQFWPSFIGEGQPLFEALRAFPDTLSMFYRRWSTVQEEFLQRTNTHPALFGRYERRIDELTAQIQPDSVLDQRTWGTWWPSQNMAQAVSIMKTQYFGQRRGWVFNTLAFANGGPYVGLQPTNAVLQIGEIDYRPSSGIQAQEYVQLRNLNSYAMDISGWKITGAIQHTFKPGTIVPTNGTLYLSPDVRAFRARTTGPRGGQGLFVQGDYKGQLSAWGESLQLVDRGGRIVRSTNYVGSPSLAQQFLRVTELMYHPPPPPPGLATNSDSFEYVELRNIGPLTLDLTGVRFTAGIEFNFTGSAVTSLGSAQKVLVVKNLAAFTSRYGSGFNIAGEYSGSLDNAGENIRLDDAAGEKILEFEYDNQWYPSTDGMGFSLTINDDELAWETWALASSWRPSGLERGSPGQDDSPAVFTPPIRVNEVTTRTDPPAVDTVELYNPHDQPVNIRGWYLSDDFGTPKKFRVATDVMIPAGGYRSFSEADFNLNPALPTSFAFSSLGDEVYLFSGDLAGNLTGYFHGFAFGAGEAGLSFGRYVNSVGQEHLVTQVTFTPNAPNSGPRVGPVVFSEIQFHPPDTAGGEDNDREEYLALRNITGARVDLYDPLRPANTWQIQGAVDYIFPPNTFLAPGGTLVVVSFSPTDAGLADAFRARYGLPVAVPLYGPYSGQLANSGDAVRLYRPGVPDLAVVPYVLVEQIDYKDSAPWPVGADGSGAALRRKVFTAYGNDPANWLASLPDFGLGSISGTAPRIVVQPGNRVTPLYQTIVFSVVATGSEPLRYQWEFDGAGLADATNSTLVLFNLQPQQVGTYAVTVYNRAGAAVSSNAVLSIGLPAYFLTTPQNVRLAGSTNDADYGFTTNNATFSATAGGNGPLSYQWRFNGATIPGATASTLTLFNVGLTNDGLYDVQVFDGTSTATSPSARLTVLLSPTFLQVPLPQPVVSNSAFSVSVAIRGNPPPFYYRWNEGGLLRGTNVTSERTNYFSFGPITNINPRNWSVNITNEVNVTNVATARFPVNALIDADQDGLPDDWERSYGLSPTTPGDSGLDLDGDGVDNRSEYVAGTSPSDPLSFLKITGLAFGNGATLTVSVPANKTLSVEYTDTLGSGGWSKLVDVMARPTARVETIRDPDSGPSRYYRVAAPRKP